MATVNPPDVLTRFNQEELKKKGYVKENYHYCKDGGVEREKLRKEKGYMTSEDIKDYAIKINKWN